MSSRSCTTTCTAPQNRASSLRKYGPHTLSLSLANRTASELKWVIRIILKDLKISFRERTVLQSLHPDAIDLFNVCSDLKRVCWTLYDPSYRLPHEVRSWGPLFSSNRPMLIWTLYARTGRRGQALHALQAHAV